LQPKGDPPTPRGTWGNLGETRGGVGEKLTGMLEYKSGNIQVYDPAAYIVTLVIAVPVLTGILTLL